MKEKIHPKYNPKAKITCACGNTIEVGSTEDAMRVEICSACHPLYTGKSKVIDAAGRIDKFKQRMAKAKEMQEKAKSSKKKVPTQRSGSRIPASGRGIGTKNSKSRRAGSGSARQKTVNKKQQASSKLKKAEKHSKE